MASGKTTVGKRLAALLDRPFVDADDALVAQVGRTIPEIFDAEGEAGFRDREAGFLLELLDRPDAPVIATGGGVVLRPENRAALRDRDDATVVWLRGAPAFLASRAQRKPHRPLLAGDADPREVFDRLHAERAAFYEEVADVIVDIEPFHAEADKPKQAMAARVAELLAERSGDAAPAVPK
jgi:shikimate kinase